ncbi:MAG: helix-turn-helix domain-containing protein [Desulfobacter sp.]|nr:MAG: helix-turn-helix domain-containing protein [Desulfobacter sp.]
MKCHKCNKEMTASKEVYHYTESGLDNVYLCNVDIYKCECGEEVASIPSLIEVGAAIGLCLIKKRTYLNGEELKFLRKNAGLNAKSFAEFIGVNKSTFSRWENNKQSIDKSNDRLVRLVYANIKRIPQDEIKALLKKTIREIGRREEDTTINIPVERLAAGRQGGHSFAAEPSLAWRTAG